MYAKDPLFLNLFVVIKALKTVAETYLKHVFVLAKITFFGHRPLSAQDCRGNSAV